MLSCHAWVTTYGDNHVNILFLEPGVVFVLHNGDNGCHFLEIFNDLMT